MANSNVTMSPLLMTRERSTRAMGILTETMKFTRQQDQEDSLKHEERMSQFRNCQSMIDLLSSKKIPQMKKPSTQKNVDIESVVDETSSLLRGCPHTRLSSLDVDLRLATDDNFLAMDVPSVAVIVAPEIVAEEILVSENHHKSKMTRTQQNQQQTNDELTNCDTNTMNSTITGHKNKSSHATNTKTSSALRDRLLRQLEQQRMKTEADIHSAKMSHHSKGGYKEDGSRWERQMKLSTAVELLKEAHKVIDPQRCYFHAGILFDSVDQHERALTCFKKSLRGTSPALVIDTYKVPLSEAHHRKLRCLNDTQRQKYLDERATVRERLIYEEERRQRLKVFIAHIKLVRLYLIFGHKESAHDFMCISFDLCESHAEHLFVLKFMHLLLSQMAYTPGIREIQLSRQLVRESAGPLAEAHIWVIRDLLNEDIVNHDVLYDWLGRRYAETSDFLASRKYFKMARDIREGLQVEITKVVPVDRDSVLTANAPAIFGTQEYGEDPPLHEHDRRWRGAGKFPSFQYLPDFYCNLIHSYLIPFLLLYGRWRSHWL